MSRRQLSLIAGLGLLAVGLRVLYAWTHPGLYDADYYVSFALSVLERGEFSLLAGIPSVKVSPLFP
ncbi:MAG: hypothetical protein WC881_07415 [Elusimicrobiota bacterium]